MFFCCSHKNPLKGVLVCIYTEKTHLKLTLMNVVFVLTELKENKMYIVKLYCIIVKDVNFTRLAYSINWRL